MLARGIPQNTVTDPRASFATLGLDPAIRATLDRIGFLSPTPIQAAVIPLALSGRDVIGLAQTGSGKTAAFALPLAQRMQHGRGVRGLILSPTREIALQTQSFLELFGRDHGLVATCVIGGVRIGPQIEALRRGVDIVVATPGRLLDHVERKNVDLEDIEHLVLDEADHMLDLGFLPQINRILEGLPKWRQTLMFSATMPPTIERMAKRFMDSPALVDLRPRTRAAAGIEHRLYLVAEEDKKRALFALVEQETGAVLVFVRRKIDAEWAARQLELAGHPVERIHSDLSQSQRVAALQGLRRGEHRILVATDIAARGIDIPVIEHIINFNVPETVEDYVHRAGRTARGAADGVVSTIATWRDRELVRAIEQVLGKPLPRCQIPGIEPYVERPRTAPRRRLR